jgi:2-polyprenyl-6-methoxyphenol hydroxylase-like FAD-dependent oxidoreductase
MQLLSQLQRNKSMQWGHKLIDMSRNDNGKMDLLFDVDGKMEKAQADLVVGADGIRSAVRALIVHEETTPL